MANTFFGFAQTLSEQYLAGLREANYKAIMALFSSDAVVISPLYGTQPAADFYRALFADTAASQVILKDVLVNTERRTIGLFFTYHWTLASGEVVAFEVIDYLQLNDEDLIVSLQIVYDTHLTRQAWSKVSDYSA